MEPEQFLRPSPPLSPLLYIASYGQLFLLSHVEEKEEDDPLRIFPLTLLALEFISYSFSSIFR